MLSISSQRNLPNNGIATEIYSLINNEDIRPTANLVISKCTAYEYLNNYVHTLGNLTITGYNSNLSNFDFEKKILDYNNLAKKEDKLNGYWVYVFDNVEDVEYFISKWSEMDIWEKVLFIGYYNDINGDIMVALAHYNEYELYMGKKDEKHILIY